jgi:hypothetical protein
MPAPRTALSVQHAVRRATGRTSRAAAMLVSECKHCVVQHACHALHMRPSHQSLWWEAWRRMRDPHRTPPPNLRRWNTPRVAHSSVHSFIQSLSVGATHWVHRGC